MAHLVTCNLYVCWQLVRLTVCSLYAQSVSFIMFLSNTAVGGCSIRYRPAVQCSSFVLGMVMKKGAV